jgi:hypothetical protein
LTPRAIQRPAARRDFVTHYLCLAEHASLDVAKRFRSAVFHAKQDFTRILL